MSDQNHAGTPATEHTADPGAFELWDNTDGTEVLREEGYWKPDHVGVILVGKYLSIGESKHGLYAKLLTPDVEVVRVRLSAVLSDLLLEEFIHRWLAIQYTGDVPVGENTMRDYRVKLLTPHGAQSLWARLVTAGTNIR